MPWKEFARRPQRLALRKVIFQVHLWTGMAIGAYVFLISATGAALVLHEEIEILLYPQLFQHKGIEDERATTSMVFEGIRSAYPDFTISAIYSPTGKRDTFMVYVNKNGEYRTAYANPVTGEALGEIPGDTFLVWLQDLHFNLLSGSTGRLLNGVGGFALILLAFTGLIVWWPGVFNWKRGLTVDFSKPWNRINWELHGALGFWSLLLVLMFGVTGSYFTFPQQYRSIVEAVSPTSAPAIPVSDVNSKRSPEPPDMDLLAAWAVAGSEGRELWGVDFPSTDDGLIKVETATIRRDRWANQNHREFYFDRFSGELLGQYDPVSRTAGDLIMSWIVPLHFGTFGGLGSKILWVALGLVPALLFVTGATAWWNRVLRNR